MSTHSVNVVRITNLQPHPNADTLDLTTINGFTCVVRRGDFQLNDLAIYIEPDYMVPLAHPLFAFLRSPDKPDRTMYRIGVKRLRGIYSMGLLLPAQTGMIEGANVMDELGITRYEPPIELAGTGGQTESPPYKQIIPTYDLENLRHYQDKVVGREVLITEKVHGTNARFVWQSAGARMYCGSRREWKQEDTGNLWWQALAQNPWITEWCEANPDEILWGEVYGWVQDLRYDAKPNQFFFRVFDVYGVGLSMYWSAGRVQEEFGVHAMPLLYQGVCPEFSELEKMADGDSVLAKHMREGIVVEVVGKQDVWDADLQAWRIKLKLPGNRYLSR